MAAPTGQNHSVEKGINMTYLENKKKYNAEYAKTKLKRIPLDVQQTEYENIKAAADRAGESVNGYIKESIKRRMNSEFLAQ